MSIFDGKQTRLKFIAENFLSTQSAFFEQKIELKRGQKMDKNSGNLAQKQRKKYRYFTINQQPLPLLLFYRKLIVATAIAISDSGSDSGIQRRYRYFPNSGIKDTLLSHRTCQLNRIWCLYNIKAPKFSSKMGNNKYSVLTEQFSVTPIYGQREAPSPEGGLKGV